MPLQGTRDEMSRNRPVSVVPLEPWGGVLLGALHEAPVIFGKLEMATENRLNTVGYSIFERTLVLPLFLCDNGNCGS